MFVLMALFSESAQAQDQPWLGLVPVVEHTEGELAGMTTYRLYLYTLGENDFLVSCSGDDANPLYLTSTSEPAWFQHSLATTSLATDVNPAFFEAFPEFAFDSWLTIGAEDNTAAADVIELADPDYNAFDIFESGQNVAVESAVGNAWFVIPTPVNEEAFSGEEMRVLVAAAGSVKSGAPSSTAICACILCTVAIMSASIWSVSLMPSPRNIAIVACCSPIRFFSLAISAAFSSGMARTCLPWDSSHASSRGRAAAAAGPPPRAAAAPKAGGDEPAGLEAT